MPEYAPPTKQKALGQYMTPEHIAEEMCAAISLSTEFWSVLDPACGDGNLLLAAARRMRAAGLSSIEQRLTGIEIDPTLAAMARQRLGEFIGCSADTVRVVEGDFLRITKGDLFATTALRPWEFNVVLSNPPYGGQREYRFFETAADFVESDAELVFLLPLASMERIHGPRTSPLYGRPMDVTTGHMILHHIVGKPYRLEPLRPRPQNANGFRVLNGLKLYEEGAGVPPQSRDVVSAKPFSSGEPHDGWLPCLRTGDVRPYGATLGRLWVNYGEHLAHPKDINRFSGPRVVLRRMPVWSTGRLASVFLVDTVLCAGDLLVVKHQSDDDPAFLKGLSVFLNSAETAALLAVRRPTLKHRMSFPKIAAKDIDLILSTAVPDNDVLRLLAQEYPE